MIILLPVMQMVLPFAKRYSRRAILFTIVWNSSGYEKIDTLQLLDGVVSIYLPDMKYSEDESAVEISSAPGYCRVNRTSVAEMLRQVGHLQVDDNGVAVNGLIVRHLVLPEGRAGSLKTIPWIAENLGQETHIALMSQYFPAHKGSEIAGMNRPVNHEEYDATVDALEKAGLDNGWVQNLDEERGAV